MADKLPVVNEKNYVFKGVFDIVNVYNSLKNYLENNMYYDLTEKEFAEKNTPPKRWFLADWYLERFLNDQYHIIIIMQLEAGGKDVEVEVNGCKKVVVSGEVRVTLNSYVEPQEDAIPKPGPLIKFFKRVYDKFIGSDELERAMIQSAIDVSEIVSKVKHYMNTLIK